MVAAVGSDSAVVGSVAVGSVAADSAVAEGSAVVKVRCNHLWCKSPNYC